MSSRFALFVLVLLLIFGLLFWLLWRRLRTKHDQQLRVLHEAYPRPTFERLRQYLEASVDIRAEPKEKNELADRSSVKLDPEKYPLVYQLLETQSFGLRNARVSREVPVEYRIYKTGSFGMNWHHDVRVLPEQIKYYEVTLTLSNSSDNRFEYVAPKNFSGKLPGAHVSVNTSENRDVRSVQTPANTAVFVPPESVRHRATALKYGERLFLKFVIEYD